MAQAAPLAITVHEYMDLPEGPPHYELIEGELHMMPPPNLFHQGIAGNIVRILFRYLEPNPIGELFFAPCGVFLTEINAYQPDIFFVSEDRLSIMEDHGIEGAPDLVIEILSPSTARVDKGAKKKIYAATGVQELWIADPVLKEVIIYELQKSAETPRLTARSKDSFESSIFPGLVVSCAEIFRDPRAAARKKSRARG